MENCIFCKIAAGEIPSNKVYEDEHVFAFRDIAPQAPVHILVIPKKHFTSMNEVCGENTLYAAKCLEAIALIALVGSAIAGGFNAGRQFVRDIRNKLFG